jgi:hypothetical protein
VPSSFTPCLGPMHDFSPSVLYPLHPYNHLLLSFSFLDQHKYGPFVSFWLALLCRRGNGNWQVDLALLLVHSVLRVYAFPFCFLQAYIQKFRQADTSSYYLLHSSFLLGLFIDLYVCWPSTDYTAI